MCGKKYASDITANSLHIHISTLVQKAAGYNVAAM